jgi:DNA polymerase I
MASNLNNLTATTSADKAQRRYEFDLETNGFLEVVTVIHSLVIRDVDTGEVTSCADQPGYTPTAAGLAMLANATQLIGHNILGYDIPVIKKLYPDWDHSAEVIDTLILSQLFFPELRDMDFRVRDKDIKRGKTPQLPGNMIGLHRLEAWGYRLGKMKGDYSDIMKEQGLDPWASWNEMMQVYCVQDVEVTHALYEMLQNRPGYDEYALAIWIEMRFADLMFKQERHGFRFDVVAAERLEAELRVHKASIQDKLSTLFAPWWVGLSVQTPKKSVTKFVQSEHGAITRAVKVETGRTYSVTYKNGKSVERKEKIDEVQRGYYETTEEGNPFLKVELRVFNPNSRGHIADRLKKLYGWQPVDFTDSGEVKIDDDILGNLPFPPAAHLAENFMLEKRLSALADGKQAWLKQVKNGRIHGRVKTLGAITGRCTHSNPNIAQVPSCENAKGVVPYGAACRALFLPDIGHVLVGCDADGLELRDLAHFMQDGGRYAKAVDEGKKDDGTDIHTMNQKAAGLPSRSNAKTFIYAFLYGAGDEKIGQIVAPTASPEEQRRTGKALKAKFLEATPGLKGLIKAVKAAAKGNGWVRGLDGRRVPVRHQHAALNSLLQNAGAVAMKLALILLYDALIDEGFVWGRDFAFLANIHDEFQISARPEVSQRIAEMAEQSINDAGTRLNMRIPLRGSAAIGSNWKETH